jgi:hypothetical protein
MPETEAVYLQQLFENSGTGKIRQGDSAGQF